LPGNPDKPVAPGYDPNDNVPIDGLKIEIDAKHKEPINTEREGAIEVTIKYEEHPSKNIRYQYQIGGQTNTAG